MFIEKANKIEAGGDMCGSAEWRDSKAQQGELSKGQSEMQQ